MFPRSSGPDSSKPGHGFSFGYGTGLMMEGGLVYASGGSTFGIFSVLPDGTLDLVSETDLGYIYDFVKQGNYVYAACGGSVRVLDVSDPAVPVITATVSSDAYHIAVTPSRAYVGSLNSQVRSYNLADPAHPTFVAPVLNGGGQITGMEVYAGHLFMTQLNDGLTAYELSSPDSPTPVGFADTGVSGALTIQDGTAAVRGAGAEFLDVTDPTHLDVKGAFRSVGMEGMAVVDGVAYIAAGSLQALDLGEMTNPAPLASLPAFAGGLDLHVLGDHLVLRLPSSVEVISIADPLAPVGVASIPFGTTRGMDVANGYAYVVDTSGFHVVDLGTPSAPVEVGTVTGSFPWDVVATGNRVYASRYGETAVFDVSTPNAPTNLGESALGIFAEAFTASGNTVYFSESFEGSGTVSAYDFTDPGNPSFFDGWFGSTVSQVAVLGDDLVLGSPTSLLRVDGATFETIESVGECAFGTEGIHVAGDGNLFSWYGSYHAFASSPALEYVSSGSTPAGGVRGLATSDDHVFVTDSGGLYVIERPCAPSAVPAPSGLTLGTLRAAPNPTSGATWFSLPASVSGTTPGSEIGATTALTLEIFTVDGRLVRSLSTNNIRSRSIYWDGRDENGRPVATGVLLARWRGSDGSGSTSVRVLR
ncbi:MAG: hypothetical protein R3E97_04810 [Candidatus Eisenbacteria bacterium]